MVLFFKKPYRWASVYAAALIGVCIFILLDAFVIPRPLTAVAGTPISFQAGTELGSADPVIGDTSYTDDRISITIETIRRYDTTIFVADITIHNPAYFRTAFAGNTFGRNISKTTSSLAEEHRAIFAINGDYYGFRENGYVLRNGVLYRAAGRNSALLMDMAGNLFCKNEADISADDTDVAWQIWSFGPPLVTDGKPVVTGTSEVTGRSAPSNPRTAIGQAGPLHYIAVVSNGRTPGDQGLSLLQLAELFSERGCSTAYNLDGGGSSCMVFNGRVLNNPTTYGSRIAEREISDIIYIGYE
jgi:exopolysaccharide biosynthesis protein